MKGLFIGLNTIDLQFLVDAYPAENQKVKSDNHAMATGGPATNAAIVYSWLGGSAYLLTPVGEHKMTPFIYNDLQQWDVNIFDAFKNKAAWPIYASIITSKNNGHRTVFSYSPPAYGNKYDIPDEAKGCYEILLFDGFHLPLIDKAAEKGLIANTVVLDGGSWKDGLENYLSKVDIAICSAQFNPPGCNNSEQVIDYLHKKGIPEVAITRGNEPITYSQKGKMQKLQVPSIKALDTLGAGDFFHGAFCYFYTHENDIKQALLKASEIAAQSCRSFGTREWLKGGKKP